MLDLCSPFMDSWHLLQNLIKNALTKRTNTLQLLHTHTHFKWLVIMPLEEVAIELLSPLTAAASSCTLSDLGLVWSEELGRCPRRSGRAGELKERPDTLW